MSTYGVADLTQRYAVGEHTVLGWIRNGELKAINVSRRQGSRPKWRITQESLDSFESRRTPTPPQLPTRSRRSHNNETVTFYK